MQTKPLIYSVIAWTSNGNGTFKCDLHLVAGFSSADAESRFCEEYPELLTGALFINTDEYMRDYGKAARAFSSRHSNDDSVTAEGFHKWEASATNESDGDGDYYPAAFRALVV